MSYGHEHDRYCYWDHERCGWVCRPAAPSPVVEGVAVEVAAPVEVEPTGG